MLPSESVALVYCNWLCQMRQEYEAARAEREADATDSGELGWLSSDGESAKELFECVVCNVTLKSEGRCVWGAGS